MEGGDSMQKQWQKPELEALDLSMTMAGEPDERVDLSFFGIPLALGPS